MRIITEDSGSRRNVRPILKSPDIIQVNSCWVIARDSGGNPINCQTAIIETANDPSVTPQATMPAIILLTYRPRLALTRKPRNGRSGIRINTVHDPPQRTLRTQSQHFLGDLCVLRG